ncbi:hypothetical protein BGZ80_009732 [Entomortierella chlamydospora]|uniref:Uncharacterized protein n=1 Tax=Entomortierella chlamydospora TaxID=101097 RepID=A0A9P6MX52_9FUNG|nr:hypothetical protein BGZ80_009732 [Entomortierella chlamydospora]
MNNGDQPNLSEQQEHQAQEASACIQGIVMQIRTVFKRGLTSDDRIVLSFSCPAVASKIKDDKNPIIKITRGAVVDDDDDDDDDDSGDEDSNGDYDTYSEPPATDKPFVAFSKILRPDGPCLLSQGQAEDSCRTTR